MYVKKIKNKEQRINSLREGDVIKTNIFRKKLYAKGYQHAGEGRTPHMGHADYIRGYEDYEGRLTPDFHRDSSRYTDEWFDKHY